MSRGVSNEFAVVTVSAANFIAQPDFFRCVGPSRVFTLRQAAAQLITLPSIAPAAPRALSNHYSGVGLAILRRLEITLNQL
jgi:hypothetical protein